MNTMSKHLSRVFLGLLIGSTTVGCQALKPDAETLAAQGDSQDTVLAASESAANIPVIIPAYEQFSKDSQPTEQAPADLSQTSALPVINLTSDPHLW